jgi:cyanate permease
VSEQLITILLVAAALVGLAAGCALAVRNGSLVKMVWTEAAGFGLAAFRALLPSIIKAVAPASPEELARQKENTDRGEEAGAVGNGPHNRWGRGKE